MNLSLSLKRRHKAVVFLTLLVAGASLLVSENLRMPFGIVLIGLALAWAFGTNSRRLHLLYLASGIALVVCSIVLAWHPHRSARIAYQGRVVEFERRVAQLAKLYPVSYDGQVVRIETLQQLDQLLERIGVEPSGRQSVRQQIESGDVRSGTLNSFPMERPEGQKTFKWPAFEAGKITKGIVVRPEELDREPSGHKTYLDESGNPIRRFAEEQADATELVVSKEKAGRKFRIRLKDGRVFQITTRKDTSLEDVRKQLAGQLRAQESVELVELGHITVDLQVGLLSNVSGPALPNWYLDALVAGVDLAAVPDEIKPTQQPEPFGKQVSNDNLFLVSVGFGITLAFLGAALLLAVKPASA